MAQFPKIEICEQQIYYCKIVCIAYYATTGGKKIETNRVLPIDFPVCYFQFSFKLGFKL